MEKIVFTKYSNERDSRFAIKTVITKKEDKLRVAKYPIYSQGMQHVQNMEKSCQKINQFYKGAGFRAAQCHRIESGVEFEFIHGETFAEKLHRIQKEQGFKGVLQSLTWFKEKLIQLSGSIPFERTKEFEKIFGVQSLPEGLCAPSFCCLDLAFDNLILGDNITIIDYEWCFDFPVPVEYVFFRALKLYLVLGGRGDLLENGIYDQLGYDEGKIFAFERLEERFQAYIRGRNFAMPDLYKRLKKENYLLGDLIKIAEDLSYAQIYMDCGADFSEKNSFREPIKLNEISRISIDVPLDVVACRLDPCETYCILTIHRLTAYDADGAYTPTFISNGRESHGTMLFCDRDPMIIFNHLQKGTTRIEIEYMVNRLEKSQAESIAKGIFQRQETTHRFHEKWKYMKDYLKRKKRIKHARK